jgi:hypothetical protein
MASPNASRLAAGAGGAHGTSRRAKIAKGLVYPYTDREVSPARVAGAGIGGAALAYGIPRNRAANSAVVWGLAHRNPWVAQTSQMASAAGGATLRGTAGLGPAARRLLAQSHPGRVVLSAPKPARIAAVTYVGAELLRHSLPIHTNRQRYYGASR